MSNGLHVITARFDVLRNNAVTEWALEAVGDDAPTVTMNADGVIKMSLAGVFRRNDNMDYLNDEIKPYLIIDGREYPVGVYMIGTRETQSDEHGISLDQIEAYDRALKLRQKKTETRLHIDAGTKYLDAIGNLLQDAGIKMVVADEASDTIATDREDWEIGTEYLTIINALLNEINFASLWFDLDGNARLERYAAPTSSNVDHEYREGRYSILREEYTKKMDIFDAPNVFIVTVANPDSTEAMTATGVNDNPLSALSTISRGRRILATPLKLDNIASQTALQQYADNLAIKSMLATEQTTFYTMLNPVHGVGDVIALYNGDLRGIYKETGWTMQLKAGQKMKHTAKKVILV